MYIPKLFREDDLGTLHSLMQQYNFATLITQHDGVPFATHLPFLLRPGQGPYGTLLGHMARANPQWRDFHQGQEVLAIFQGPHAYVSPSWYEVHPSVPTWNYAAVHAYGTPRVIDDDTELYALMHTMVEAYEGPSTAAQAYVLPVDFVYERMQAVVGFTMRITRLEGKCKLSQNRPVPDQRQVIKALQARGEALSTEVADLMRQRGIGGDNHETP
jgi:transcriptional regulator